MGLADGWGIGASAGLVFDGYLRGPSAQYDVQPGFVLAFRGSKTWIEDEAWWPFVATSVTVAAGWAGLTGEGGLADDGLLAFDLRAEVSVGKTLFGFWTPYVALRVFGAPLVLLDGTDTAGSDPHHYQLAFGTQLAFPSGVAAYVDWSPLGERSLSVGLSWPLE